MSISRSSMCMMTGRDRKSFRRRVLLVCMSVRPGEGKKHFAWNGSNGVGLNKRVAELCTNTTNNYLYRSRRAEQSREKKDK